MCCVCIHAFISRSINGIDGGGVDGYVLSDVCVNCYAKKNEIYWTKYLPNDNENMCEQQKINFNSVRFLFVVQTREWFFEGETCFAQHTYIYVYILRVFITRNRRTHFFYFHAILIVVIIKLKLESGWDSSHELFNRVKCWLPPPLLPPVCRWWDTTHPDIQTDANEYI